MAATGTRRPRGPRDVPGATSAHIVDVARASFARSGYAGTSLRGVAREAGVDPALVHHYFGSKSELLDAATTPPAEWLATIRAAWDTEPTHRGEAIVANMLRNWADDGFRSMMMAVLLTAADDERTRNKLTDIIASQLLAPADTALEGEDQRLRAGFVAAHLLGFMFMRYVWRVEPLASVPDERVLDLLSPVIQHYLDGGAGPVPHR